MRSFDSITDILIIRDITSDDFTNLKSIYNDQSILRHLAKISFDDDAISERLSDMVNYRKLNLQLSSAIIEKKTNKFIGLVRVDFYPSLAYLREHNMQIKGIINDLGPGGHLQSAYLLSNYQNKGHMTEVMTLLIKHLAKDNIRYIFGSVNNKNVVARKLLNKFGFKYILTAPVDLNPLGIPITVNKLHDEYFAIIEAK